MGILTDRLFGAFGATLADTETQLTASAMPDERKSRIIRRWTYYHGANIITGESQWTHLHERFQGMPAREYESVENHVRICVDRLRRLLVNSFRGFEFSDDEAGAEVRRVLDANRWPQLMSLAVLNGMVAGDAFIKLMPDTPENPTAGVRLVLLDAEAVDLETSPHDRDDVRSVTVAYDYTDIDERGRHRRRHYREIINRESVTAFIDGEYVPGFSREHGLGFIPVVHIRNMDTGGDVYGESVVERLIEAQDAVNLIACDLMDIVRYDGHKTTVFQNVHIDRAASRDGMTPGEIDLSIGKGLVVRGEGKVYKLEQQHDLGAALQEYERKLDALYDLAGVPRLSHDTASRLGNLSGRAIERLWRDAVDSTREAQLIYGESFGELARKIARMTGCPAPHPSAVWNTDVITPEIETLAQEHAVGARSRRSVMRKLGITDIDAMLAEIAAEGGVAP